MNISFGYTRNKDDSFDIIQNVFYKLFNSNKQFKTDNDEKYWMIRVTINESLDLLRKRKREIVVDENTIDVMTTDIEDKEKESKLNKLSLLVKELPKNYKSVIILFYYDLLPIKEIVNILGISEIKREYNSWNLLVSEAYYDEAGNETISTGGFSRIVYEYDAEGNTIKTTKYDTSGKVVE